MLRHVFTQTFQPCLSLCENSAGACRAVDPRLRGVDAIGFAASTQTRHSRAGGNPPVFTQGSKMRPSSPRRAQACPGPTNPPDKDGDFHDLSRAEGPKGQTLQPCVAMPEWFEFPGEALGAGLCCQVFGLVRPQMRERMKFCLGPARRPKSACRRADIDGRPSVLMLMFYFN